jgi:probable aminopeptidase NPEPL1
MLVLTKTALLSSVTEGTCGNYGIAPEHFALFMAAASSLKEHSETTSSIDFVLPSLSGSVKKVRVAVLPSHFSRHNTPSRSHSVTEVVKGFAGKDDMAVFIITDKPEYIFAQAISVPRAFPVYSKKSSKKSSKKVEVVIDCPTVEVGDWETRLAEIQQVSDGIMLAMDLVDRPPNELHTDMYVSVAFDVARELGCAVSVIQGRDLEAQGFGGIWGVGKASEHLPALVVLSWYPEGSSASADKSVCLVGKGIVYDTGGLSIKVPPGMVGMKEDMGGSAAVLGAFRAIVGCKIGIPVHALLCIAENSVGPLATRPDDIHTLFSGKTVEVNNTDAEGRLVLADGCAYASSVLNPRAIIDIATLTGAQLITTGRRHAAIVSNTDNLEAIAVTAGKYSGDLTFPIIYCPEFLKSEFSSKVADMKNSVKDRSNAQSSCAGQFIGNHIDSYMSAGGEWLHVDMAGPVSSGERATGYGVALLFSIAKSIAQG